KSGPATAAASSNITYSVTVTNNGPSDAQSVTLTDALPAGTTFVSEAQTGPACDCTTPRVRAAGSVSCSIATLASNASATFTLIFKVGANVASGTTLTNTASATSPTDSTPGNNNQSTSATVNTTADLAVTKSGPLSAPAGSNITYSVTITNNGPSDAQGVTMTDALPAGTTFVSETQTSGPTFNCTPTVSCGIATLPSSASATFTLIFKVAAHVTAGVITMP